MSYFPSLTTLFRVFSLLSVISISSIAGLLYTYQTKLIYPSGLPPGAREDKTDPSSHNLPFEQLWLKTPDGEKLQAWFIRPNQDKIHKTTVVMFQANAGNIAHRLPIAAILYNKLQVNVFMLSYRGYGLSSGSPAEAGIKIDAQVAMDWIRQRHDRGEHKIVLYGQSLGGAVAIDSAVRNPWIDALMLENTFLDIPSLIPSVLPPAKYFSFLCREIWPSKTRIRQLNAKVKVLFLAGGKDELVPPAHMKELYSLCTFKDGEGKEWKGFENGTHNDTCLQRGYFPTLASFLHRRLGHETALSREALSQGYKGGGKVADSIEEELKAYDDEDDEYEYIKHEEAGHDGLRKRTGASATHAAGAGSVAPGDIADEAIEEIQTEGVRAAARRARDKGSL